MIRKSTKIGGVLSIFTLFVMFLFTVSCSSTSDSGGDYVGELSLEEQYYLGKATSGLVLKEYTYLDNEEVNDYLRLIGVTLSSFTNLNDDVYVNYSFVMLDTNALVGFASPKGFIMISKGLMKICANEDEFAGIVALMIGMNMTNYPIEALPPKHIKEIRRAIEKDNEDLLTESFKNAVEHTYDVLHSNYPPEKIIYAEREAIRMMSEVGYSIDSYKTALVKLADKRVNDRFNIDVEGRREAMDRALKDHEPAHMVDPARISRFIEVRSKLK